MKNTGAVLPTQAPANTDAGPARPLQIPMAPAAGFVQPVREADPPDPYRAWPVGEGPLAKWQWAGEAPVSGATAKAVLLALAYHANKEDGAAFMGRETLAQWTGSDRRTVMRALRTLERDGWIVREERDGRTTLYRLKAPWQHLCRECGFSTGAEAVEHCPACGMDGLLGGGRLPPRGGADCPPNWNWNGDSIGRKEPMRGSTMRARPARRCGPTYPPCRKPPA